MSTEKKPNVAHQLLASIKKILFDTTEMPSEGVPVVVKTAAGTELSVSKLETGGVVTIAGVAAPADTYTLEDGSVLVVDAAGTITSYTPPVAPAAQAAAPVAPVPVQAAAQAPAVVVPAGEELKTPEGLRKLTESFAVGTPEERLANLELVAKALMEYSFGWEIRKAKEEADRAAAIKVYTDQLATTQAAVTTTQASVATQQAAFGQVIELMEQVVGAPTAEPPGETKARFSFTKNKSEKKGLERYQAAAKRIVDQAKASEAN